MVLKQSALNCLILLLTLISSTIIQGSIIKRETPSSVFNGSTTTTPIVYLTVSSLASNSIQDRLLELNWENLPSEAKDNENYRINLYDRDPGSGSMAPLVSIVPNNSGYYRTSIRFPEQVFDHGSLGETCLGFWVALFKNNTDIITSKCIRAHPHWMFDSRSQLGNLTLMDLMIPGTHNSGSFAPFDSREDSLFKKYLLTQDTGIYEQMVFGIRYLDLRVAYHRNSYSPERFWITHSSFRTEITVKDVINQVKEFLRSTHEIVIMDFHRFTTGFHNKRSETTRRRHLELIALLEQELGELLIPKHFTTRVTLNDLWGSNRRLYVGYADERARTQSIYTFPAIRHLWGEVENVGDLEEYLNQTVCNPERQRLTSAMAHLTPTTTGVLFNAYGGLRKMADQVNRQVTKWFRYQWNHCVNIVSTDYFLGNNLIELAIETNKKRSEHLNAHF